MAQEKREALRLIIKQMGVYCEKKNPPDREQIESWAAILRLVLLHETVEVGNEPLFTLEVADRPD